jgi:hypothetical protein
MVSYPSSVDISDVVFDSSKRVGMEVITPVKVILLWWIIPDIENDEQALKDKSGQCLFLLFLDHGRSLVN